MRTHLALLQIFLLILAFNASALDGDSFEEIRSRYMSLRNRDSKGVMVEEWRDIVDALTDYTSSGGKDRDHESALFFLGVASEKVFGASGNRSYYLRARKAFLHVSKDFKNGDRGDDALLALGDLLRSNGEDEASNIAYQRILKDFPASEIREVAKRRLAGSSVKSAEEASPQALRGDIPIVILDPGHGGEDFGAVGLGNLLEKDVALDIAIQTKRALEKSGYAAAELTRSFDQFVPLADRTQRANHLGASLLISIHANASPKKDLFGVETYYLDVAASDEASKKVSERENASGSMRSDGSGDIDLILTDLMRRAKQPDSKRLAETVHESLLRTLRNAKIDSRDLGVKKAPFYILAGVTVPSVLIEVGFLDHEEEGIKLADRSFREKIASGLAEGVKKFLRTSK